MRKPPRLEERQEARRAAFERTQARIQEIRARGLVSASLRARSERAGNAKESTEKPAITEARQGDPPGLSTPPTPRSGNAATPLYVRGQPEPVWPQPWLHAIVDGTLATAASCDIRLTLVWPGQVESLGLIHALATLERMAIGDKRGLRALLYPTTRMSFSPLAHFLVDRDKLLTWARHYLTVAAGVASPLPGRDDQNKDMMLMALQSARNAAPESDMPMLSEVLPHFDWDRGARSWGHYGDKFLRRSKDALQRTHKRALFRKEEDGRITQLGNPELAPDALFAISHLASPRERREAVKSKALRGKDRQPELVLFDLTRAMQLRAERPLVRLSTELIKELSEAWKAPFGFMIVTDDPKAFFIVRKHLTEKPPPRPLQVQTIVTAPRGPGLSSSPLPRDWQPDQVSLKHFRVCILDQEAVEVAARFWSLAEKLDPGSDAAVECRKTAAYLLRLANLPGGYRDFTAWMASQAFTDLVQRDMSWSACVYTLNALIERGAVGAYAEDARRALGRATQLVETYGDMTPLAARLAKEIGADATKSKNITVVLFRFSSDISVARSYLERYAHYPHGVSFKDFAGRVSLRNHRELPEILGAIARPTKFIFVGLPDETLRLLVSSEDVPADSVVIVDYRRAHDVAVGLRALKTIDTYKAYRGRISGLAIEIAKRLNELPSAIDLDKLDRMQVPRLSLSTAAAEHSRSIEIPGSWKIELEGGRRISVGHRVYVYDPDGITLFRHEDVERLQAGDLVFVMSDVLKDMLETALIAAGHAVIRGASLADIVREYHRLVLANAKRIYGDLESAPLARRISARMVELNVAAKSVSLNRIDYWLDVRESSTPTSTDRKPHSTRKKADFVAFAQALEIPENLIEYYWIMTSGQRIALQEAGRELAERYARVLFSEESAEAHYKLPRSTILTLQREAVQSTYRVLRTIPPTSTMESSL